MVNYKKILLGSASGVPDQTYWIVANDAPEYASGGNGLAVDSSQNLYTGFKYPTGTSSGNDCYVQKHDLDGVLQWSKTFGGTEADSYVDNSTDGTDIYSLCNIRGVGNSGTYSEHGLFKINASGASQFQKKYGANYTNSLGLSGGNQSGKRNIFANSNIYTLSHVATDDSLLVLKYNTSGTRQFVYKVTANYQVTSNGFQVDSSGNMYMCGRIRDTSSGNNYNGYVIKTNSSGVVQWTHQHGGTGYDEMDDLLLNGSDLYVTGRTATTGGSASGVCRLQKLNASNGNVTWQKELYATNSGVSRGEHIAMDSTGALYLLIEEPSYQALIVKLDTNGNTTWARRIRDGQSERKFLHRIVLDKYDNMCIVGGSLSFNPTTRHEMIYKLPNDGTGTGTYQFSSQPKIIYESVSLTNSTLSADTSSTSVTWTTTTPNITDESLSLTFSNTGFSSAIKTVTAG